MNTLENIPVMLAVRNPRNGNIEGLSMAHFCDDPETLCFETDPLDPYPFEYCGYELRDGDSGTFVVDADHFFEFRSHRRYVGNICWDRFVMEAGVAASLATLLLSFHAFTVTCHDTRLARRWH